LRRLPGIHDDWLICMISSQVHQKIADLDEVIIETDEDFQRTGLKTTSLVRVTRLVVLSSTMPHDSIGKLSDDRLHSIRTRLAAR